MEGTAACKLVEMKLAYLGVRIGAAEMGYITPPIALTPRGTYGTTVP